MFCPAFAVTRTIKADLLMGPFTKVVFDNQAIGPGQSLSARGDQNHLFPGTGGGFLGVVLRVIVLDAGGSRSDIRASIQVLTADRTSGPALAAE